ncbi:lysylphosphatidylglycerol synthase transmembrane domain-containing protein [Rhodohalobacter barkolensis]|uniref:TIGR00374 family protein n=1 Tax=Rhodohalobacter barkolensis TaxID=2053187 RepID=A0A2N0VFC8_9BACT|nr:lysylphosphatidylglycerol synthase transmembrane domain-containing protein [Rhodohalobacter barkolensis]PKD42893.1 TIGR00374 family protein [Rhodohalobacter barkolensis]
MALSIALSLISMGIVIYLTYKPGILEHLAPKRLPGIFVAIGVTFLKVYFFAAKIRFLADKTINWMASIRIALTWDFASAITPSTIGGAPVATYAMTKEGIKLGKSSAIVLYGVLLDQFWYALAVPILLVSSIYFNVIPDETGMVGNITMFVIYAGLLIYGGLLAYGLLINPKAMKRMIEVVFRLPLLRKFADKVNAEADNMVDYSRELRQKPISFVVKAFLLSTLSWLCRVALPVIVVLSLLPAQEVLLVLRSLAMNLAFLIIPTPGGSGGVEGLFAVFLGPLIDRTAFIGLAVFVWRLITYYFSIGLGIVAMLWYVNTSVTEKLEDINQESDKTAEHGKT